MAEVSPNPSLICGLATVAQEFGCSERQIQLYARAGMPKAAHGQYDLVECFRWRLKRLENEIGEAKNDGKGVDREKERLTKFQADLSELDLSQKRGELMPVGVMRQLISADHTVIKQRFMQLPNDVAHELEGEDRTAIKIKLKSAVAGILTALATGKDVLNATADILSGVESGDSGSRTKRVDRRRRTAGAAARRKHKRVGRRQSRTAQRNK
jgi:phage terminase Nu1 subunit (DNA packaging protein)